MSLNLGFLKIAYSVFDALSFEVLYPRRGWWPLLRVSHVFSCGPFACRLFSGPDLALSVRSRIKSILSALALAFCLLPETCGVLFHLQAFTLTQEGCLPANHSVYKDTTLSTWITAKIS